MATIIDTINSENNWWREVQQSLRFSLPLLVSYAVEFSSPFLGIAMVAHLGADALAASGLAAVIYLVVQVFFFGTLNAVGIMVAHNFGAKTNADIGLIMRQGFWVSLVFGIPLVLLLWIIPPLLLHLSGQTTAVINLAIAYLRAISLSLLPLTFAVVMEQFLIGIGRIKVVLWISLLQVPLEIILIYLFVFGKFGIPSCGIAGVGYGLTAVFTLAAIVIWLYLLWNKDFIVYRLFRGGWQVSRDYFYEILRVGVPTGVTYAIELGLYAVISFFMGCLGRDVLAAHQIAIQYIDFTESAVIFSIVQTTATRISHAVGAQNRRAIRRAFYVDSAVGMFLMLAVVMVYWLFPRFLIALDLDLHDAQNASIVQHAISFLAIGGMVLICDSTRFILTGALRALKDTRVPMLITTIVLWLLVLPLAYWFGLALGFGGRGIWYALVIGVLIITTILYIRFTRLVSRADLAALVGVDND
jgi:multidrug resistance protein, MATE family